MQNKLLKMAFICSLAISSFTALADDDDSTTLGTDGSVTTESTIPSTTETISDEEDLSTGSTVPSTSSGIVEEDDESSYE